MTNPFKGKPIQFGRPIIGTGDPMKLVNDLKKELISRQNARPAQDSIDLGSTPPPRIKLSQIQHNGEIWAAIGEQHAQWLNKEMFFYLPKSIYESCFTKDSKSLEIAKAELKSRGIHWSYDPEDTPCTMILWRGNEKLASNTVYFEEEKGE